MAGFGDEGSGILENARKRLFAAGANGPVQGQLQGDTLLLLCNSSFTQEVIGDREVLNVVSEKASGMLGRKVRAIAVDKNKQVAKGSNFEELLSFGSAHSDTIKIKK